MEKAPRWTTICAAALALLFALLSAVPAFPASEPRIQSVNSDYFHDPRSQMEALTVNMSGGRGIDFENLMVSAGAEVRVYLEPAMFLDADGNELDSLSRSQIKRIGIATQRTTTTNVFEEVSVQYDSDRRTGYIKIAFVDPFASTGRRKFRTTFKLKVGGTSYAETAFEIEGSLTNTEIKLEDEGIDYVRVEPHEYLNPSVHIRSIEVDLGGGISVHATLFANRKYYGAARATSSPGAENAEIDVTYSMSYINLAVGATVSFDLDGDYYVYNGNGDYLGTTSEYLPAERTFHMTTRYVEALEVEGRRTGEDAGEDGESSGRGGGR